MEHDEIYKYLEKRVLETHKLLVDRDFYMVPITVSNYLELLHPLIYEKTELIALDERENVQSNFLYKACFEIVREVKGFIHPHLPQNRKAISMKAENAYKSYANSLYEAELLLFPEAKDYLERRIPEEIESFLEMYLIRGTGLHSLLYHMHVELALSSYVDDYQQLIPNLNIDYEDSNKRVMDSLQKFFQYYNLGFSWRHDEKNKKINYQVEGQNFEFLFDNINNHISNDLLYEHLEEISNLFELDKYPWKWFWYASGNQSGNVILLTPKQEEILSKHLPLNESGDMGCSQFRPRRNQV